MDEFCHSIKRIEAKNNSDHSYKLPSAGNLEGEGVMVYNLG